jgi:hypothetical protein
VSTPARVPVQLFPPLVERACAGPACKAGCEGCGKGPAHKTARLDLDAIRAALENDFADSVDLWVADYSTGAGRAEAIERINRLLRADNIALTVTPDSLDDFLAQSAPVIAIGERIASIIVLPTRAGLAELLARSPA